MTGVWAHMHHPGKETGITVFFFSEEKRLIWEDNGETCSVQSNDPFLRPHCTWAVSSFLMQLAVRSETFSSHRLEKILSSWFSPFLTSHCFSSARSFISPTLQCWRVPAFRPQTSTPSTLTPMGHLSNLKVFNNICTLKTDTFISPVRTYTWTADLYIQLMFQYLPWDV